MTITSTTGLDLAAVSAGLLVLRLVLGLAMAAHGAQKVFGWFGGYGLAGTGGFFEQMGFRPGKVFAALEGSGEVASGLLVAFGLLGPVGPAIMISLMLVAILTVHRANGFFVADNGIEHPFLYAAGALGLALTGFGAYSLDALVGLEGLASPTFAALAVALGVLAGLGALVLRRPVAQAAQAHG